MKKHIRTKWVERLERLLAYLLIFAVTLQTAILIGMGLYFRQLGDIQVSLTGWSLLVTIGKTIGLNFLLGFVTAKLLNKASS
jgi:hypothetical protein